MGGKGSEVGRAGVLGWGGGKSQKTVLEQFKKRQKKSYNHSHIPPTPPPLSLFLTLATNIQKCNFKVLYLWDHIVYDLLGLDFLFTITLWKFIQVVACVNSSFLFIAEN